MSLPLTQHPVVLAAAEEMAREAADMAAAVSHQFAPWSEYPDPIPLDDDLGNKEEVRVRGDVKAWLIEAHARLLCDLTRPASRDWWVRWGRMHHAGAPYRFDRLRDNPEALAAAIFACVTPEPWPALGAWMVGDGPAPGGRS